MNPQLPEAVERDEEVQRTSRRRAFGLATDTPTLGIALSGGGIRSATLCLGAFQYFAREERRARAAGTARGRLLSRIDYCSSVSGGGYFATFFTSLFLPKHVRDAGSLATPEALPAETVDAAGPPPPTPWEAAAGRAADVLCDEGHASGRMTPLRWLRENGRYLAPNGGSDYLYAAATAIRNFLALHYVIAVSIVALFLLVGAARVLGFALAPDAWYAYVEAPFMPDPSAWLWPSAWWALAVASFALVLVPAGVAYFLAQGERWSETLRVNFPLITAIGVAAACIAFVASGVFAFTTRDTGVPIEVAFAGHGIDAWRCAAAFIAYVALAAIALYAAARLCGSRASAAQAPHAAGHVAANATEPAATTITRTKLSHWLLPPLYVTLAIAGYALVDTVGQTLYARYTAHALGRWAVGGGVLALLIALAKRLLPLVSGLGDSTTPWWKRIPATAFAFVAGIGLALVVAAVWSTMTHALVFGGAAPFGDPGCLMGMPADAPARDVALDASGRIVVTAPVETLVCGAGAPPIAPLAWLALFAAFLIVALFTGRTVGFINLSSLQRYYSGHLMRSYLRASLFAEDADVEPDVRKAARRDDIALSAYYNRASLAPIHLVNVTMSQTLASGSSLVDRDRKGANLAIGPFGFALGRSGFVGWNPADIDDKLQRCPGTVLGARDDAALPGFTAGDALVMEPLSIGNWCAISGAALTTGHGKGTTLGLSLLLALTNVRLGYWWNTAIAPADDAAPPTTGDSAPPPPANVRKPFHAVARAALAHAKRQLLIDFDRRRILSTVFRAQTYLAEEMTARYHGARRSHWYLSDGGHFENTAAYELVRRRVRHIVALDNGRDAGYAFDDVANLVRKARIDFGARIEFMSRAELWAFVDASVREHFGAPQDFAPGGASRAYAMLARIRYDDGSTGLLLVVKPRVTGLESIDIRNYHATSADFPQQTTNDQFYDEAQWESYRALGAFIAETLFAERTPVDPRKWIPRRMFD